MRKRNALKYYPGYYKSRSEVLNFTDRELYELLDALYGRDNLPDDPTHSDLLHEALQQHQMDWLTPEGKQEKEYLQRYARAHGNPMSDEERIRAIRSGRRGGFLIKGGIKKRPVYRYFVSHFEPDEAGRVLDFGATARQTFTRELQDLGYNAVPYDFDIPGSEENLRVDEYDFVLASNVLNTQPSLQVLRETIRTIFDLVAPGGLLICNYPKEPRYLHASKQNVKDELQDLFENITEVESGGLFMCMKHNYMENPAEDNIIPDGDGMWIID